MRDKKEEESKIESRGSSWGGGVSKRLNKAYRRPYGIRLYIYPPHTYIHIRIINISKIVIPVNKYTEWKLGIGAGDDIRWWHETSAVPVVFDLTRGDRGMAEDVSYFWSR